MDFGPKQSGWLINQLGAPQFRRVLDSPETRFKLPIANFGYGGDGHKPYLAFSCYCKGQLANVLIALLNAPRAAV